MPSAADPKRSVRLAPEDLAMLETASQRCNIAVGALIRECVRRSASAVAADASAGRVTLRRRSAAATRAPSSAALDRVPEVAASLGVSRSEARKAIVQGVAGVKTARELMLERQRKLNERHG